MKNPLTYQEIKEYIESLEGNGCKLLMTKEEVEQAKKEQNKSNSNVKLKLKCRCGNLFEKSYSAFKMNFKQCPKCSKIQSSEKISISYQDVKKYINSKNTGNGCVFVTEEENYKDTRSYITIKCKCGNDFITTFDTFKHNHKQCPKCGYKNIGNKLKLDYNYIKRYINDKLNGNQCILLSQKEEYGGVTKNLLIKCRCGDTFYTTFNNFRNKNKKQCDTCTSKNLNEKYSKTDENFKREVYDLVKDEYSVLSDYINSKEKMLIRHNSNKCNNYEYKVRPNDFLRGKRCPKCYGNIRKTQEQFEKEIYDLIGDEYTVLGKYKNTETKILIRHNSKSCDNFEFNMKPSNFLTGNRCPCCAESKGEQKIRYFLDNHHVSFNPQYTFDELIGTGGGLLRYDFAIFEEQDKTILKLLIEYDGEFHYEPIISQENLELQQIHDNLKDKYCKENNIDLLRIPYWDFDNIEEIITNKLSLI